MDVFQYMEQNGRDFFATSVNRNNTKAVKTDEKIWRPRKKKDHLTGKIVGQPDSFKKNPPQPTGG